MLFNVSGGTDISLSEIDQAAKVITQEINPEAKVIYEDFIAAHPKSEWVPQAEFALRYLDREIRAQRTLAVTKAPVGQP